VLAIDGHSDGGLRVVRALLDTIATAVLKRPHLHVATTSLEGCVSRDAAQASPLVIFLTTTLLSLTFALYPRVTTS